MNIDGLSTADILEMHMPGARRSALTVPQLAHAIYGVPVNTVTDQDVNRERRTAIRNVQAAIAELRNRGVPICSDETGLWRAETALEAMEAYRALRRRALGQLRTAAAVKRAAFAMRRAEAKVEQTSWLAA